MESEKFSELMNEYEDEYFERLVEPLKALAIEGMQQEREDGENREEVEMRITACAGAMLRHAAATWVALMSAGTEHVNMDPNCFMALAERGLMGMMVQASEMPDSRVKLVVVPASTIFGGGQDDSGSDPAKTN